MPTLNFRDYTIEKVDCGREINYVISKDNHYVCRLVPGYLGFEVSKMDKALDNDIEIQLLAQLSNFIVGQDD